jgi:hypothetical protein
VVPRHCISSAVSPAPGSPPHVPRPTGRVLVPRCPAVHGLSRSFGHDTSCLLGHDPSMPSVRASRPPEGPDDQAGQCLHDGSFSSRHDPAYPP